MATNSFQTIKKTVNVLQRTSNYVKYINVGIRKQSVWTQDGVVKSPFRTIQIPNGTLYDYVWQNLDKWPERTISVCAVTGRGYTYEQAFQLSNAFAANLRKKFKIQDNDCVVIMLPNIPDFPLVAMGILEAGGVISTINPVYTAYELQRQILMSDAKLIVTIVQNVNTVKEALKTANINIPIVVVKTNGDSLPDGTVAFNELSEDVHVDKSCLREVRRNTKDLCFLPYSSGTTGLPKGVELTHNNLVANCEQINEPEIRCYHETTDSHQDAFLAVLPFFHIYGATVSMFHTISNGVKLVTLPQFKPELFAEALVKYKTNIVYVAPPLVNMMSTHPAMTLKTLEHLDVIITGSAPLSLSDADRFLTKINRKIRFGQGYGLTETSPVIAMSQRGSVSYDTVGHAISNTELKVVDSDMKSVGPNKSGELLVKGPQVMRGYRNNPEATKGVFTDDGWFRTGDLAIINEGGEVTITDRLKELIKVKGYQVPPAELEAVLRDHPAIDDAAVIGVPHPTKGETPKAFVVLKQGSKIPTKAICEFVKKRVAEYKRIDDIVYLDNIPKSAAGKILRKELKQKYLQA